MDGDRVCSRTIDQERWPAYVVALAVMQFLGGLHLPWQSYVTEHRLSDRISED